jgi:hypothetical protein
MSARKTVESAKDAFNENEALSELDTRDDVTAQDTEADYETVTLDDLVAHANEEIALDALDYIRGEGPAGRSGEDPVVTLDSGAEDDIAIRALDLLNKPGAQLSADTMLDDGDVNLFEGGSEAINGHGGGFEGAVSGTGLDDLLTQTILDNPVG